MNVRKILRVSVCPVLGHVLGELHEVLSVLQRQQRQDPAITIHAMLVLAQTHVKAGALPQVAHVGGVVLNGWRSKKQQRKGELVLTFVLKVIIVIHKE